MPWVAALLTNLLGTAAARVLTGAGLGLATFAALTPLVLAALNAAATRFNGIASNVANVMLLSGFGLAVTMIGSAMLTRVAIDAGKVALTKT